MKSKRNVSEEAWNTVESFACYVISDIETIIIIFDQKAAGL